MDWVASTATISISRPCAGTTRVVLEVHTTHGRNSGQTQRTGGVEPYAQETDEAAAKITFLGGPTETKVLYLFPLLCNFGFIHLPSHSEVLAASKSPTGRKTGDRESPT